MLIVKREGGGGSEQGQHIFRGCRIDGRTLEEFGQRSPWSDLFAGHRERGKRAKSVGKSSSVPPPHFKHIIDGGRLGLTLTPKS